MTGSGHKSLCIYRWSDQLHNYNFDVQYVTGSNDQVADTLSGLMDDSNPDVPTTTEDSNVMEIHLDNFVFYRLTAQHHMLQHSVPQLK